MALAKPNARNQPVHIPNILDEAQERTSVSRNKDYGHPTDNFNNISILWNGYLKAAERKQGQEINNLDVAMLNILQKVARLATNQTHTDSLIDLAGYARTAEMIIERADMEL